MHEKLVFQGGVRIVASDFVAVCESGQARSDIWDSPSGEARRTTGDNSASERKTVRSGVAYDINDGMGSNESSERAKQLKEELGSVPVSGIEGRVAYRFVKRAFDIVFSVVVLVVFCWLFAIIAILIKIDDPKGPVFFSQERDEQVIIRHNFGSCLLNTIKAQLNNGFELVLNKSKCAFGRKGRDSVSSAASMVVAV